MSQYEPPPFDADYLPPDLDEHIIPPDPEDDYLPPDMNDFGYLPDDDPFLADDWNLLPDEPLPLAEPDTLDVADDDWGWVDARVIGLDRGEDAPQRYEIGAVDLYGSASTGDLGGSYLPIASFDAQQDAAEFYHDLQGQIHEQGLRPDQVPKFAEGQARAMNPEPANWRGALSEEYAAYEQARDRDFAPSDEPPAHAIDDLAQTAVALTADEREQDVFQALNAIGVEADGFDPNAAPPPFFDQQTNTAYWIGVFQADPDDPEHCVTSILSLGRDQTGAMNAQLAPCVPGDWDKAHEAAEYLIGVAQKGGIDQLFDAAEGMALATDQRERWQAERGLPLTDDKTQEIADYAADTWEVEL